MFCPKYNKSDPPTVFHEQDFKHHKTRLFKLHEMTDQSMTKIKID